MKFSLKRIRVFTLVAFIFAVALSVGFTAYARVALKHDALSGMDCGPSTNHHQVEYCLYMHEGTEFLADGSFDRAEQAFQFAHELNPSSAGPKIGIQAANFGIRVLPQP